jgi:hypothetical protein
MAINFNQLNMDGLINDKNISVEIAREIEVMSWADSKWSAFLGRGENRGIRTFNTPRTEPYRPRLKAALTGKGVRGNADFDTNIDKLEIYSQTIYPVVVGNALDSEIEQYQSMKMIDFVREAKDSLTTWIRETRDRFFYTALANNLTNAVVADATNGVKDISTKNSVQAGSKGIVAGDVVKVSTIKAAIKLAKIGKRYDGKDIFPMKPVKSSNKVEGGITQTLNSFVILLDTYQIFQLLQDPEWKDMQSYAPRAEANRIFTGLIGMIDGCPVIDMGCWSSDMAGMVNSETSDDEFKAFINPDNFSNKLTLPSSYANSQPVSMGYLIGAGALIMGGASEPKFYVDSFDAGRKTKVGVDRLFAIAKSKFEPNSKGVLNKYANTDYAVIGILSSKE